MVFALVYVRIVRKRGGNRFGLVAPFAGTERSEVDFDKPENVRIQRFEEPDQALQVAVCLPQVARTGNRQMKMPAGAGSVADIVENESHAMTGIPIPLLLQPVCA